MAKQTQPKTAGISGPRLTVRAVSKAYEENQALRDVTVSIGHREVLGLAGENGAGKSTLLNILSGVVRADSGEIETGGEVVRIPHYRAANEYGIFRVYQELSLVPNVPVYENLFITHEDKFRRFGILRRSAMLKRARELFEEFDHGWIDPGRETGSYDFAVRQVIDIIKAFAAADLMEEASPILLLDEPTAGLLHNETEFFADLLRKVRARASVIFVSHRLSELLELCDSVLVLKDGRVVGSKPVGELGERELHHLMVGRNREDLFYKEDRQREEAGSPLFEARGLKCDSEFEDVDLTVSEGEILGIGGVLGSGKSALARALFDSPANLEGVIRLNGADLTRSGPAASIRAGMGYIPPERHDDGVLLGSPVSWNISLPKVSARKGIGAGRMNLRRERREAVELIERVEIKTPGPATAAASLSGGNQQKVVLARWLACGVDLLVMDNPTRGVDAGAKEEIYSIIRDLTDQGAGVVLVSDDLPELIGLSSRILLMKDGRVVAAVETESNAKPSEVDLIGAIV